MSGFGSPARAVGDHSNGREPLKFAGGNLRQTRSASATKKRR